DAQLAPAGAAAPEIVEVAGRRLAAPEVRAEVVHHPTKGGHVVLHALLAGARRGRLAGGGRDLDLRAAEQPAADLRGLQDDGVGAEGGLDGAERGGRVAGAEGSDEGRGVRCGVHSSVAPVSVVSVWVMVLRRPVPWARSANRWWPRDPPACRPPAPAR